MVLGILSYIWCRAYVGLVQYSHSNVVPIMLEIHFLKRLLKGLYIGAIYFVTFVDYSRDLTMVHLRLAEVRCWFHNQFIVR